VTVAVVIVVTIPMVVSVAIPVPVVTMFESAPISFPVAIVELVALIARPDPASAIIGRACPIPFVPAIVTVYRVPVSIDPDVVGTWPWRPLAQNPRRWRRTNPNAEGNLRMTRWHSAKQQDCKNSGSEHFSHGYPL